MALPPRIISRPTRSLALPDDLENKRIPYTDAVPPPFVPRFQRQIMDMPLPLHPPQPADHAAHLQLLHKRLAGPERRDLVPVRMDDERRHPIPSRFELRHGADGLDFGQGGGCGEAGGREAVEHHAEAVALFEEGEDELGAGVARADPAEVRAVGAGGGVVGCDLRAGRSVVSEGRMSRVTGRSGGWVGILLGRTVWEQRLRTYGFGR